MYLLLLLTTQSDQSNALDNLLTIELPADCAPVQAI